MDQSNQKRQAQTIGILFIIAAVASIIGLILYNPLLKNDNYLTEGILHKNTVILGVILELVLVSAAVGTGITLFPHLKKYNERYARAYLIFRTLEAVFIMIGIVSILGLLSLSELYVSSGPIDTDHYHLAGNMLKSIHSWTFMLGPNFMLGLNTFCYSFVLWKFKMIPSKLATLGIISAIMIFIAAILELFGVIEQLSTPGFLLAFPIFVFEMTLAVWLIAKGFKHKKSFK